LRDRQRQFARRSVPAVIEYKNILHKPHS
jgi:hypothetical protein